MRAALFKLCAPRRHGHGIRITDPCTVHMYLIFSPPKMIPCAFARVSAHLDSCRLNSNTVPALIWRASHSGSRGLSLVRCRAPRCLVGITVGSPKDPRWQHVEAQWGVFSCKPCSPIMRLILRGVWCREGSAEHQSPFETRVTLALCRKSDWCVNNALGTSFVLPK